MELSPPYLTPEAMPLGPRVITPGLFLGYLAPLHDAIGGGDGTLFSLQQTIAGNTDDGLDGVFTATIGAAEDVAAAQGSPEDDQTAAQLTDAGAGVDVHRTVAAPYLPQADTPIVGDFRELPNLGDGHPGGGGIEPGDPTKD